MCLAGNFEEALVIFERLESKSPHNLHHKVMIGDALLGLDNIVGAEKKYDEVLQTDATNAGALAGMVKTSSVSGNFKNAKTFFDKMEGNFESSALASFFNNRGVALVKKGNIQEAIQFYENALQFFNKYKGIVYFNLGMAYFRSGNISSAVNSFQAAIAQESALIQEKKILQELKEKGVEKFIEDYSTKKVISK
jgi:tetratricopeptide (TPR) repeat protein